MEKIDTIEKMRIKVRQILQDPRMTHEQTEAALALAAENVLPYPEGAPADFERLYDAAIVCDLSEGHAPYCPRYILPDYEKLMREGCAYLRLTPPKTLYEAVNTLLIFYRNVPSVTHFPVYMGHIDRLLEPFLTGADWEREVIRGFLLHCDRTFGSSFCHMNLGPAPTRAGRMILELEAELQNSVPNMTLIYDPAVTPDDLAELAIRTSLKCANPAMAFGPAYDADFGGKPWGLASCYNGLPVGGGAFTLSRLRLNKIAQQSAGVDDFFDQALPAAADALCAFIEAKIRWIVNEIPFFKTHFLVTEGFVALDAFVGLFGVVGLCECVDTLMQMQGSACRFGPDEEANQLGLRVMDALKARVESFQSAYSPIWDHHFMLHAQVGAEGDIGTSPGVRIAIGKEIPLYDHLRQAGLYHKYFPSGVGDIFPFDETADRNPGAVLDIFKGAFRSGMRYISTYSADSDLIRVTGYLVKKSEVFAYAQGKAILNETVGGSQEALEKKGVLQRKVRSL